MNGHDEETYERKDLPTAFISREEHEKILWEYNNYKVQAYEQLSELEKLREELKEKDKLLQTLNDQLGEQERENIRLQVQIGTMLENDPKFIAARREGTSQPPQQESKP